MHDEVILEGPRETADAARARVVACMRSPFSGLVSEPLLLCAAVSGMVVGCRTACNPDRLPCRGCK